jgi:hypothetical protein
MSRLSHDELLAFYPSLRAIAPQREAWQSLTSQLD